MHVSLGHTSIQTTSYCLLSPSLPSYSFNMLFLLCLILHCFTFILVLDIVCSLLLFAPCSFFFVTKLTIEMLNNMHMLLLQPSEMSWREVLFYDLDIAKRCLSIRMHNGMFHKYSGEKE